MRRFIASAIVTITLVLGIGWYCADAQYVAGDFETAVQSLGSNTRASISRQSRRGIDVDAALRYQTEGDQALRRGDLVRAAEEYGRAEEAIHVLNAQRVQAENARARTLREIARARRNGTDIAQAEIDNQRGDQALDNGDFVNAQVYYAFARATLAMR